MLSWAELLRSTSYSISGKLRVTAPNLTGWASSSRRSVAGAPAHQSQGRPGTRVCTSGPRSVTGPETPAPSTAADGGRRYETTVLAC